MNLIKNDHQKGVIFAKKSQNSPSGWGKAPRPAYASGDGGLRPQTPFGDTQPCQKHTLIAKNFQKPLAQFVDEFNQK